MIARMAVAGLVLHGLGALLRALPHARRGALGAHAAAALASPASLFVGLAVAYGVALRLYGLPILSILGLALVLERRAAPPVRPSLGALTVLAALSALVLARPMTPTFWDEFVWLGKARLESVGFGAGVREALDPSTHLMPPGYPMFWPSAVGWLAGAQDDLGALTLATSLLLLAAAGAAVDAWASHRLEPQRAVLVALVAPFVWIHARSTYVDLPVGLLGLALAFELTGPRRSPFMAAALGVALAATKDEGVAHAAAAVAAGLLVHRGEARKPALLAAAAALVTALAWHGSLALHEVPRDHGGSVFVPAFLPRALALFVRHATDLRTWGLFWAATAAALPFAWRSREGRALGLALAIDLVLAVVAICAGPPRVRAFAENGTLVNRILLQLWPLGAALVLEAARGVRRPSRP